MTQPKIQVFNSLASDYDAWFEQEGKLAFASEVEALKQVLPLSARPWIEIGAGSGRFVQALGIDVGLDPSGELLKIAANRGAEVLLGKGEAAPFRDGTFGAAFLITSLCFVDSPERVLNDVARILKCEGEIVLGLLLKHNPWGRFYQRKRDAGHRLYRYATFHTYGEVVMRLIRAGFIVEKVISTLFQGPGGVNHIELPQPGFSADAGFTVILAKKPGINK